MKSSTTILLTALAISSVVDFADAHGRLISPPHRGYIGKLPKYAGLVPINYDDNGLSAGGIGGTKGGKHGVCGDPYSGVRQHETGGTYGLFPVHGSKVVGACYAPGSTVDLQVQLTANHKGYFQFGLCKLNGKHDKETNECFQTLIQPNGDKQWQVPPGNEVFTIQSVLPAGVTCEGDSHCVLRWHYVGWNNPGVDINGQEQFWNCADVYISNTCGSNPAPSSATPSTSPRTTSAVPTSTKAPSTSPSTTVTVVPTSTKAPSTTPQTTVAAPTSSPKPTQKPTHSPSTTTPTYATLPPKTTQPSYPTQPPKTTASPTSPTQAPSQCGQCANCYYPLSGACFVGWTAAQCASIPQLKWCGSSA
ncbi:hypothetical protein DYB31_004128 [Aphanomyces astaci]|uniref:Uncharacterized protein n=1 Tax=Aphanomyces astaci TaxID=112090 RepID=A0A397F9J7_APHAT|nr:hypothetical protein DYB31_004128 [Aphanomyces astaci]